MFFVFFALHNTAILSMHALATLLYKIFISYKYSLNKAFPASLVWDEFAESKLHIEKRLL